MLYKIRGEDVEVDKELKILRVNIRIPLEGEFSLSDRIVGILEQGYTAFVTVDGLEYIVTAEDEYRLEKVPSKFKDAKPWYRHWYNVNELGGM